MTRQIIEGKLLEMKLKPWNIQVAIQGTDKSSVLFLINENGIIKTIKLACDINEHVTSQPVDMIDSETRVEPGNALCNPEGKLAETKQRLQAQSLELLRMQENGKIGCLPLRELQNGMARQTQNVCYSWQVI